MKQAKVSKLATKCFIVDFGNSVHFCYHKPKVLIHTAIKSDFLDSLCFYTISDRLTMTYLCCETIRQEVRRRPSAHWSGRHAWHHRAVCRWVAGVGRVDTAHTWHSAAGRMPTPESGRSHFLVRRRCRERRAADDTAPSTYAPVIHNTAKQSQRKTDPCHISKYLEWIYPVSVQTILI